MANSDLDFAAKELALMGVRYTNTVTKTGISAVIPSVANVKNSDEVFSLRDKLYDNLRLFIGISDLLKNKSLLLTRKPMPVRDDYYISFFRWADPDEKLFYMELGPMTEADVLSEHTALSIFLGLGGSQ